jgi:hypothetical protein
MGSDELITVDLIDDVGHMAFLHRGTDRQPCHRLPFAIAASDLDGS